MAQRLPYSNNIPKLDGVYFHILKHGLTLLFKAKKVWLIAKGKEIKLITTTIAQIVANAIALPSVGLVALAIGMKETQSPSL